MLSEVLCFLFQLRCELRTLQALLIKELLELWICNVFGSIAISVLSITAGFDQIIDRLEDL